MTQSKILQFTSTLAVPLLILWYLVAQPAFVDKAALQMFGVYQSSDRFDGVWSPDGCMVAVSTQAIQIGGRTRARVTPSVYLVEMRKDGANEARPHVADPATELFFATETRSKLLVYFAKVTSDELELVGLYEAGRRGTGWLSQKRVAKHAPTIPALHQYGQRYLRCR